MERPTTTLVTHGIQIASARLLLRPMTESDWPALLRWNQDPRVLYYSNGGDTTPWSMEKLQKIYRRISQHAFMFLIEQDCRPIGDCWLQEMNLAPILEAHPGQQLFRIDISLGEPDLWGHVLGTEAIHALVDFGFGTPLADAVFACDVSSANIRSRRAFARNGFQDWGPALGAGHAVDATAVRHLVLNRSNWERLGRSIVPR